MPVAGRKPKPAGQAVTRHKPTHDWVDVRDLPFRKPRKLPLRRPDGRGWPAWTKAWWEAVSTMPHCVLWSGSDWRFAVETALVAAEFHEGKSTMATELRNREKVLGTTVDYRRDLRIRYVEPSTEQVPDNVTSMDDFRSV